MKNDNQLLKEVTDAFNTKTIDINYSAEKDLLDKLPDTKIIKIKNKHKEHDE